MTKHTRELKRATVSGDTIVKKNGQIPWIVLLNEVRALAALPKCSGRLKSAVLDEAATTFTTSGIWISICPREAVDEAIHIRRSLLLTAGKVISITLWGGPLAPNDIGCGSGVGWCDAHNQENCTDQKSTRVHCRASVVDDVCRVERISRF